MALTLTSVALLVLVPAVVVAAAKPVIQAPPAAARGHSITVTASGLRRGIYGLTLFSPRAPSKNDYCARLFALPKRAATAFTFIVTIPRTMPCFSGYPAASAGHISLQPGRYTLLVDVPGRSGFSRVHRSIRIR